MGEREKKGARNFSTPAEAERAFDDFFNGGWPVPRVATQVFPISKVG